MSSFKDEYTLVSKEVQKAFDAIDENEVYKLVDAVLSVEKVFVIGVGRVFLALKDFAKRLHHLGVSAHCVGDPTEPAITENDLSSLWQFHANLE